MTTISKKMPTDDFVKNTDQNDQKTSDEGGEEKERKNSDQPNEPLVMHTPGGEMPDVEAEEKTRRKAA